MIVDAWGQHPTLRHSQDPILKSLRRWTKTWAPEKQIPVFATIRTMDDGGVDRMLIGAWEVPPTDSLFYPVYTACVEERVPFCTQIGHTGPLMPSEVGRPIYLCHVALDFPELTIVGGHIGYPRTQEAIAVATKHENVFIGTPAYTARRPG